MKKINYALIKQKPYCCVPACVCMILDRRGIKHSTQEELGYELGLIVPKEKKYLFKKVWGGKKPLAGWGTRINLKKYSLNNFFKKNKIGLNHKYYYVCNVWNSQKFLIDNLKKGNDVIACFNYKKLYGEGGNVGHVSLVESLEDGKVVLVDPARRNSGRRLVSLRSLIGAIKYHSKDKSGGFWLISKNK